MHDSEKLRQILGQMSTLSLVTDKDYCISIAEFGRFEINKQNNRSHTDVVWYDLQGRQHQVTRENIEWILYELNFTTADARLPQRKKPA